MFWIVWILVLFQYLLPLTYIDIPSTPTFYSTHDTSNAYTSNTNKYFTYEEALEVSTYTLIYFENYPVDNQV